MYYLLLSLIMPAHELYAMCRGRSSLRRWRLVAGQLANALGIIGSMYLASWLVLRVARRIVAMFYATESAEQDAVMQRVSGVVFTSVAWVTIAVLAAVVFGAIAAGFFLSRRRKRRPAAPVPAPVLNPAVSP